MRFIKNKLETKKKKQKKAFEETATSVREEIRKHFKDFLEMDGRLPEGFSEKYNEHMPPDSPHIYRGFYRGTPFEEYLSKIHREVDQLRDESGISDWLFWDGSSEIASAAEVILQWLKRHREENRFLKEKCKIGDTVIMTPVCLYCTEQVMVVIEDGSAFRNVPKETIQKCKSENLSFCVILSENKLFDLVEQKEKEITYVTYPNYHDETYANWELK